MNYICEYGIFFGKLPVVLYWPKGDWDEDNYEDWVCNECVWFPLGWIE